MRDQAHALFNQKTIDKLCSAVNITDTQNNAITKWLALLKTGALDSEKKNYFKFGIIVLRDLLGYNIEEDLNFEEGNVEFSFTHPQTKKSVCIEVKGTSTKDLFASQNREKPEHQTPIKQTWDYMGRLSFDYGIATNYRDFVLIDRTKGYSRYHVFDFMSVQGNISKIRELIAIFSFDSLLGTGLIPQLYHDSILEEREFTNEFYKLYHETRLMLIKEFQDNGEVSKNEAIHYAQLYLNRLIFIFFAEDTGKLPKRVFSESILQSLNPNLVSEFSRYTADTILTLFERLDKGSQKPIEIFGFNGGLFHEKIPNKVFFKDLRPQSFFKEVLQYSSLKKGVKLDEYSQGIVKKLGESLNPIINNLLIMSSFDFHSELNVNILGHIFEQSLTDLEEIKGSEGGIPKRKKEGIYYTERYITEYICKNTIIPYLSLKGTNDVYQLIDEYSKNIDALEKRFREIKILDPACGSGAFLLQAVDTLLDVHREITRFKEAKGRYVTTKKGKKTTAEVFTLSKWSEEEEARKIIENNIFGVDLNEESVEITKLSLFLKIASTNRKLIDLSQNIKTGNSIIDDKSITEKGFVWEKEFPDIFKKGGFDIVIGNPPYGRYGTLSDEQKTYLKEKNYLGDTADISESFILAAGERFVKQDGFFGFIIPKGLSYVVSWGKTRQHILDNFNMIRLADASEAFPEVLYEQMIFVLRKENKRNDLIELSIIRPDSLETTTLERTYFTKRIFPIGLSCDKIPILKKIQKNCIPLREGLMDYWYGKGGMTPLVNKEGKGVKLLTGKEIARFGFNLDIEPWYLKEENLNETDKKRTSVDKVVVQDIVAHITKPKPHIMITAALDKEKRFCLNTVMCFAENGKGCSNEMLLAVLNSKFMSFYYYYFVFNQAVRTMHFMPGYSDYIPIPRNYKQYEPRLVEKCRQMIALTDNYNILKAKFINRAKDNIGLERVSEKLDSFYTMTFQEFVAEVKRLSKKSLSLKEQDEWEGYFRTYKLDLEKLKNKIDELDGEIDEIVFNLYDLNQSERKIVLDSFGSL